MIICQVIGLRAYYGEGDTNPSMSDSEKERFQSLARVFLNTVEVLSESAESQCEIMDYHCVAFELIDDANLGRDVIESEFCVFTESQKKSVRDFLAALNKIPSELKTYTVDRGENIEAMSHDAWIPIRERATKLLIELRSLH